LSDSRLSQLRILWLHQFFSCRTLGSPRNASFPQDISHEAQMCSCCHLISPSISPSLSFDALSCSSLETLTSSSLQLPSWTLCMLIPSSSLCDQQSLLISGFTLFHLLTPHLISLLLSTHSGICHTFLLLSSHRFLTSQCSLHHTGSSLSYSCSYSQ
jgi:hypothetical protein